MGGMTPRPTPWPRLRDSWWVFALAGLAIGLFPIALVVEVRCGLGRCAGARGWEHLFALDRLGSLPRLYTTGVFVAVAVLAWVAARRTVDRPRQWWTGVAVIGVLLAVAKLVSVHSTAKGAAPVLTLLVGVVGTLAALGALTVTGRRWGIAAARPIVLAMALYAAAALGLDAVSVLLVAVQSRVGLLSHVAVTFAEELGEALAALFLLVTVRWQLPAGDRALSTPRSPG
jgi:hypothetical protein